MNEFQFLDDTTLKILSARELEEADNGARIICLITGATDDGEKGWVFVAIRPSLYQSFYAKCQTGEELLPEAYGEIIAHGKGLPPPAEVVGRMKTEYGFDPHFSDRLVEDAKKQQKAFFMQQEALRINAIVATLKNKKKEENF